MAYCIAMTDQVIKATVTEVSDGQNTWRLPAGLQMVDGMIVKHVEIDRLATALGVHVYYHYRPTYYIVLRPDGTISDRYNAFQVMSYLHGVSHREARRKPLVTGVE